ncbi:FGGY-family carbohydrate kinase [Mesorhizobium marinum]|uniref:FGGY-family carbohydrate kinase n=1 Tax=Mesorhizobium marinum TaxID=3228790 RepID=UPI003465372D
MVGAWVLDAAGHPLRPAITWEDGRTKDLIDAHVADMPDFMSRIFASSGSVMQQGCTLPVMAWLARHEPHLLSKAAHVVSFKDYLRFCFTGTIGTDRTEAAVLPGSAAARDRSDDMISLFGLEPYRHLLPPVEDSEALGGNMRADVAAAIGVRAGLPVAVGAGDVAATVLGTGVLEPGTAAAVLGTACMVGVIDDRPVFDPPDVGLLFTLPADRWYRAMLNVAGTLNLDWAFNTLAPDLARRADRFAVLDSMLDATPPGAHGLTYLPYLSQSGIIAPVVDPAARAQFSGLVPRHDRACMFRAVLEGVAFAMADLLDVLSFQGDRLVLVGGGARNDRWSRMIADIVGRRVVVPEGTQFGARGAAWLAAAATGHLADIVKAGKVSAGDRIFEPSSAGACAPAYKTALAAYRTAKLRMLGPAASRS